MARLQTDGVDVESNALRWARERRGLDLATAAKKLGLDSARLQELELGSERPSASQLREAANVYRVSPASFFLPDELRPAFEAPSDFRTMPADSHEPFSIELRDAINRVYAQVRILRRLIELPQVAHLSDAPHLASHDAVEANAERIRKWLELAKSLLSETIENDASSHLDFWIRRIESKGYFITQVSGVNVEEMRGFCLPDPFFPMIVLNGADAPTGRLFSLIHELVHLLGGESGVCNDPESSNKSERFCNELAAATLMPEADSRNDWVTFLLRSKESGTTEALRTVSRRYGVSPESLMRRFVTLGLANFEEYMSTRALLLSEFASKPKRKSTGGPDREVLILRNLGRPYVEAVMDARRRLDISDYEAAQFIFAKTRWLEPVEQQLALR